jgi:hypothetical protein
MVILFIMMLIMSVVQISHVVMVLENLLLRILLELVIEISLERVEEKI